mgnify:FL=1|jgi:preprotein translocase subunit SecA
MLKNLLNKTTFTNKYQNLINQINSLENNIELLTDNELRNKTKTLQKQYSVERDVTSLIAEAFAVTREAAKRTLGLRHYDVQLMGGLVLNSGKIAEMRTGEGKTLVATLPAYLNALTGKGVHIITVNDYLARRDQVAMGQIYRFLGLDTGLIQEGMKTRQRQENYKADITYVTNSELGFDYLRDNMALNINDVVLRPFNYCIIDEIDSILIDEARTPLIISGSVKTAVEKYIVASEVVKFLEINLNFKVDEKNKNVILTESGTEQVQKLLDVKDLYNERDPWIPFILNALKARTLFFRNVHYIVQNDEILIVDEFTGRIMPDRRWSDGLHQAIEAKEDVPIRSDNETLGSITYQNFFLLYPKLAGMTGTAKTSEVEFEKIYDLSVEIIPTAKPNLRKDLPDLIYKNQLVKWKAIAKECKNIAVSGQPILIGTTTIEKSEMLAQLLKDYNLSYQLLNAKPENIRRESQIIAQAGQKNVITIATNMAGRGTDIILGGNIHFTLQKDLYNLLIFYRNQNDLETRDINVFTKLYKSLNFSHKFLSVIDSLIRIPEFLQLKNTTILQLVYRSDQIWIPKNKYECAIKFLIDNYLLTARKRQKIDQAMVKNLGGLYIIGTERHESRRIDNQLRGRCGRQGDPGTSRFFLSLDDNLLKLFGGPTIQKFMQDQLIDDSPLESQLLTKSLDSAQKKVEEIHYDSRRYLFDYDEVLSNQRNVVFYERRKILESTSVKDRVLAFGEQVIGDLVEELNILNIQTINQLLSSLVGNNLKLNLISTTRKEISKIELETYLFQEFWLSYEAREAELQVHEIGVIRDIERNLLLVYNDIAWKEHLQKMSLLRDAVGWRSYGQRNPLYEYKDEAYTLFQNLNKVTRQLVIFDLFRTRLL